VQQAGVAALTGDQSLLDTMRRHFQRRRDLFAEGLGRLGYRVQKPKATFYVWAGIPDGEPSARFARRLLDDVGVVVTPGAGFGPHGEGYFRAALTVDEARLTDAIARIGRITQ
jgi:LL-diaminopimelate aminotransferase